MDAKRKFIISLAVFIFSIVLLIGIITDCNYTEQDIKHACEIVEEISRDFTKVESYEEVEKVYSKFDVNHEKQFKMVNIRISGAHEVRYVYDETDNIIFSEVVASVTYRNIVGVPIFIVSIIVSFLLTIAYAELIIKGRRNSLT